MIEARERLGMRPMDLLAKLQIAGIDISSCTLYHIEAQKRALTERELETIARVLKVSIDWLHGRDEQME